MPSKPYHILLIFGLVAAFLVTGVAAASTIGGVGIFPDDHVWNVPADTLPVDACSSAYVQTIGTSAYVHADFGSGLWAGNPIGIPYNIVSGTQKKVTVTFDYADESDPGPYPIPDNPVLEGGSDRHMLIIDRDNHMLYELFAAEQQPDGSWNAGSGAVFDLSGYELRPEGWTSADAAGLAILPGMVRYEEVAAGEITHAIRFTAPSTRRAYVWPARHYASSLTGTNYPPMGQRFRLKSSFDTSGYPPQARVVLEAMKKYGVILSDNGGAWYITGVPDERWDNDDLHSLHQVKGSDFEAVDSSSLMIDPDSGQARTTPAPVDRTPPQSVTGLSNTSYRPDAITWTWTDPADADLARVMVYLDGTWKANVTKGTCSFTATGLSPATAYTVATRTVDASGNANASLVSHTARTSSVVAAPPTVTSITPRSGTAGTTVTVTDLHGSGFVSGATVTLRKSGASDIRATDVAIISASRIQCRLALPADAAAGSWDVVVENPDHQQGKLASGFTIVKTTSPTITSISPDSGRHGTTVSIRNLAGTGFQKGARIELAKPGLPAIAAKSVKVVSSSKITCTFSIPSRAMTGYRDLVITNPDGGTFTLQNGFRVR